jgi:hypothetical protein
MPKLANVRERRHQPYYDSLVRKSNNTTGADLVGGGGIAARSELFTQINGSRAVTNFSGSQVFPSDQTFVVLAYRVWLFFMGNPAIAIANGRSMNGDFVLYQQSSAQLYWTHEVAEKAQFTGPTWYFPAGGGIDGCVGDTTLIKMNNGEEGQDHILKLAKPVLLPPRQGQKVLADIIPMNDSLLTSLNNATGECDIKFMEDGLHSRDVL